MSSCDAEVLNDIPKIKAVGNHVLLELEERPEKVGSLFLPGEKTFIENVQERAARVVSLGKGRLLNNGEYYLPKGLEEGARVLIRGFHADVNHSRLFPVETGGKEYCLMVIDDLMAVLTYDVQVGHLHAV